MHPRPRHPSLAPTLLFGGRGSAGRGAELLGQGESSPLLQRPPAASGLPPAPVPAQDTPRDSPQEKCHLCGPSRSFPCGGAHPDRPLLLALSHSPSPRALLCWRGVVRGWRPDDTSAGRGRRGETEVPAEYGRHFRRGRRGATLRLLRGIYKPYTHSLTNQRKLRSRMTPPMLCNSSDF